MKYDFHLPGIKETPITLSQPLAIRLVPWLLVVMALIGLIDAIASSLIASFNRYQSVRFEPSPYLLLPIIFAISAYFLASRVKHGDMLFVWVARVEAVLALIGLVLSIIQGISLTQNFNSYFPNLDYFTPTTIVLWMITILFNGYIIYTLFKYEKDIQEGGKSFQKLSDYKAERELFAHRLGILIIIILPVVTYLGYSGYNLWQFQGTHQKAIQHDTDLKNSGWEFNPQTNSYQLESTR